MDEAIEQAAKDKALQAKLTEVLLDELESVYDAGLQNAPVNTKGRAERLLQLILHGW